MRAPRPTSLHRSTFLLFLTTLTGWGCDESVLPLSVELERETFVATYVELRLAALDSPRGVLPEPRRDSILAAFGVTPDELLEFASVRGRNPSYMAEVWEEVTARMDGEPVGDADGTNPVGAEG